jgi:hypothetical protein
VPLQHFLYTGSDSKTSEELFLLMESNQPFNNGAYRKALDAKKARSSASKQEYGAKHRTEGGPGSDRTLYVSLVNMLRKKELTPCVIFTFSKKRCEAVRHSSLGSWGGFTDLTLFPLLFPLSSFPQFPPSLLLFSSLSPLSFGDRMPMRFSRSTSTAPRRRARCRSSSRSRLRG